jgi:hypothetical protein
MSFQRPFRLSSNTPSNAFQRPTVTPPHTPQGVGSAPLEDGAPNAGRGRPLSPGEMARYFSAASRVRIASSIEIT